MNHDEYTDYSCSTSIERLARDVETLLRKWHLVGSDRHVSFSHKDRPVLDRTSSQSDAELIRKKMKARGKSRSLVLDLGSEQETNHLNSTPSPVGKQQARQPTQRSEVQLIRTHPVNWNIPLADGSKATLALNLDLWDGPSDESASEELPLSLRRLPLSRMPLDLFADLSAVFGIGQHITLSLKKDQDMTDTVVWALGGSLVRRHDDKLAPWVVTSTLSGILQTALQCALSNTLCNIPAFGIWGVYAASSTTSDKEETLNPFRNHAPLLPGWIQEWHTPRRRTSIFRSEGHLNRSLVPPILKSSMLGDTQFWMSVMPAKEITTSRLTVWGDLLLQHSSTPTVMLCGAKHLYSWKKSRTKLPRSSLIMKSALSNEWREGLSGAIDIEPPQDVPWNQRQCRIPSYQRLCREYAMSLIERISGSSPSDPLWGPIDDPIDAVHVIVRWDPKATKDGSVDSLLSMPLKIRSEEGMTKSDWVEIEEAVERSILDPLKPSSFHVNAVYDSATSLVNLAASLRLLLAALIRTTVLPVTTMMHQLTNEVEMDVFSNEDSDAVTESLLNRAGVGPVTRQLVKAVDWTTLSDEMIEGWEAEGVVQKVMDGSLSMDFPEPPDQVFTDPEKAAPIDLFASLPKSAPTGRLLSILFVHMSRLRSPASMALVWTYFVHDLQKRFYTRTSLPNMTHVPGIDPQPSMINEKQCFSTSGLRFKAENAAFVHCSEPQPDDMHCLIGQKLQVFNICIESLVATDMYNATKLDRNFERDGDVEANGGAIVDYVPGRQDKDKSFDKSIVDESGRSQFDFYDATENGSQDAFSLFGAEQETNTQPLGRLGARCPVFGVNLSQTGDQLYAPYLRRPIPWTDDVILERQYMLSKTSSGVPVLERLEIAHRYLRPKLLSDMQAFMAANPGVTFTDFVNWYGNPGNTLEEFDKAAEADGWHFLRTGQPIAVRLDRASEAIQVIACTRDFWAATWKEAFPLPAIEQPALFDLVSTVEIVLDNLETIHPASLLNQVMAVNLSMAYFTMVATAGNALLLSSVKASLQVLREKTETALNVLSRDVTHGTADPISPERLPRHASLESIRACEDACNAVSDSEALLSRVASLLDKFPKQYEFVEGLLGHRNNDAFPLDSDDGRNAILGVIQQQQGNPDILPRPSRRSYVLRNTDEQAPCQMCVRYGEDGVFQKSEGGLLVAITKTRNKKT